MIVSFLNIVYTDQNEWIAFILFIFVSERKVLKF